jgi:alpha-beta hydrolase superfamily lysophospholipase
MNPTEQRTTRIKRWKRRAIIALTIALVYWLGASGVVAWTLTHRIHGPFAEQLPRLGFPVETYRLTTSDGLQLGAWLARGEAGKPAVLLLHGLHGRRGNGIPLMKRLHDDGYNVLTLTLRAHGDSDGSTIDFGYSSRADVIAAVDFLNRQMPGSPVVVCGTSLGSAAALFAANDLGQRVRAYVLESPYQDLDIATRNRVGLYVPVGFETAAYWGLRLWASAWLPQPLTRIAPVDAAATVPQSVHVTILSGARDRFALPSEARAIYDRVKSHGTLVTFNKGGHGRLFRDDPNLYYGALRTLLAP